MQRLWDNDRFINALYYIAMAALVLWFAYYKGWIFADFQKATPKEAIVLVEEQKVDAIIDVREKEEFGEGYLKGAHNIPLSTLESAPLPLEANATVLVYCNSGSRSISAARTLKERGFKPIHVKEGLIGLWRAGAKLETPKKQGNTTP